MQDEDRPSPEQDDIVASALQPLAITACAGSGKTRTAVRRLAALREKTAGDRGQVLLLSFSNVAVDTFTQAYSEFARKTGREPSRDRVRIQTIDGCLTNDILRPHAYRTMKCRRVPFLVTGSEGFLQSSGFTFYMERTDGSGRYPLPAHEVGNLFVRSVGAKTSIFLRRKSGPAVEIPSSMTVLARWAAIGAYTHSFGQYWAYQTLKQQQWLAAAMARRYPHILVDEAQDIAHWHQGLLELLMANGSQVSLIGDPHQAIFEFAGADGRFLKEYGGKPGVLPKKLSMNFRSVKAVQDVANLLSDRQDGSDRTKGSRDAGAFFFPYHDKDLPLLESAFLAHLLDNKLEPSRSAVICRGQALKKRLRAYETEQGEGLVKQFTKAALLRDEGGRYHDAYKVVVASVCDMLEACPNDLAHKLSSPWTAPGELRAISHLLWSFTRDPMLGLPSALLAAKSEWHPQLLVALGKLVKRIEEVTPYRVDPKYRARIRTNKLPNNALLLRGAEDAAATTILRVSTVHGVKGESLDAVLYITERSHATEMANGTLTEVGRIGYVALTRARDIFWMAVPATAMAELRPKLLAKGLVERAVPGVGEQVIRTKRTGIKVKDATQVPPASVVRADAHTVAPDASKAVR